MVIGDRGGEDGEVLAGMDTMVRDDWCHEKIQFVSGTRDQLAEAARLGDESRRVRLVMSDAAELFGTRGLVKIRGAIDGEPFAGALMAQGDGTHRLPVRATLRKAIGKEAGDRVHVRIDERIG